MFLRLLEKFKLPHEVQIHPAYVKVWRFLIVFFLLSKLVPVTRPSINCRNYDSFLSGLKKEVVRCCYRGTASWWVDGSMKCQR